MGKTPAAIESITPSTIPGCSEMLLLHLEQIPTLSVQSEEFGMIPAWGSRDAELGAAPCSQRAHWQRGIPSAVTQKPRPKRGGFGAWSVPHSPSEPPRVGRLCPGGAGTRGAVPRAATAPKMLLALGPRLLQHQHVPGSIHRTPVDWECWGELVLFQHRDQLRPGDKTPQEPFTSRAKLTSFEGREEPSAGPCLLQTSGHLLH